MEAFSKFLEFELIHIADYKVRVYSLVTILIILLVTKAVLFIIKKTLFRQSGANKLDKGNTWALFQIIKYIVWVIATAFILETIGIQVTVLIAGSAALLVGIGLGLQQTFNDVISGIILLSERSIKVDDILQIDGDIVKIQSIGLRTSKGLNRDEISIIIPNSLITNNKVINWSHQSKRTRFKVDVGVAYGSDVDLVIKSLEESTLEHSEVSNREHVEVRFLNFGNSSLDFQILFYSENIFGIDRIKSDIRKNINRKFTENNITIPFPQMDLHLKSNDTDLARKNS
ncbi:MAG: mechanosensitive ion channel protein MscS [Calditrichaeota bacterium]|nr:MAG: mechanosensitive ion channel protein MscS [Calditrichota bacterium]